MKSIKFVVLFLVIAVTQFTLAQIPQTMSYQGVLTGTSGTPVPDGTVSLTFRLYDSSENGDTLWQETQDVQVTNGIFNVILGSNNPLNLPFDKQYWLGITISGGTELTPRVMLTASPYSLNSHSTLAEIEPGQGLTIRDSNGNPTHQLNANGDVTHKGVGKFLGGIIIGDTIIVPVDTGSTENAKAISPEKVQEVTSVGLPEIGESATGSKIGVFGVANEIGVQGQTTDGVGVFGVSETGYGIIGQSNSIGVYGQSLQGAAGVVGSSKTGAGIVGGGGKYGGVF